MKIALIGYGKMGRIVEEVVRNRSDHEIALIINNSEDLHQLTDQKVDVAIEFTHPHSVLDNISFCLEAGIPLVVGTTGWHQHMQLVEKSVAKHHGSLLYASNFSVGMNIFFEINRRLARLMNAQANYTASVSEIHHVQKIDAPSGTAISLAEDILLSIDRLKSWNLGDPDPLSNATILPIVAHRKEDVPGTHTVSYHSFEDTITIEHRAHNREGFALGAMLAAEFIATKHGLFNMSDVLSSL